MESFLNTYRYPQSILSLRNRDNSVSAEEAVKIYIRSLTENYNFELPEHRTITVNRVIDYIEVLHREYNIPVEHYPHSKNVFRGEVISYLVSRPNDFRRVIVNREATYEPNF